MHRDFWQEKGGHSPYKKNVQQKPSFSIDSDTALILALVLLLQREKSDPLLTLALLYILS